MEELDAAAVVTAGSSLALSKTRRGSGWVGPPPLFFFALL